MTRPAVEKGTVSKTRVGFAAVVALATLLAIFGWRWRATGKKSATTLRPAPVAAAGDTARPSAAPGIVAGAKSSRVVGAPTAERMTRAGKILRDYDEMQAKLAADFSAAGASFPGGLDAFLQQLNLLKREKRADLLVVLAPDELEEFEFRESANGKTVQRLLGDTAATDEQRRAVFRLLQESEDGFPLRFDLSPAGLLAGETERVALAERIYVVLGDALFPVWLNAGGGYAEMAAFVQQQGLTPNTAVELWRAENEFVLGRLAIKARTDWSAAQRNEAGTQQAVQTRARVESILGPAGMRAADQSVFGWLPRPSEATPAGK